MCKWLKLWLVSKINRLNRYECLKREKKIESAISFLESSGYGVIKRYVLDDSVTARSERELMPEAERQLTVTVGELIHGLGNLVVDKQLINPYINAIDGRILQELGHVLRCNVTDHNQFLIDNGIDTKKMTRAEIAGKAEDITIKWMYAVQPK